VCRNIETDLRFMKRTSFSRNGPINNRNGQIMHESSLYNRLDELLQHNKERFTVIDAVIS